MTEPPIIEEPEVVETPLGSMKATFEGYEHKYQDSAPGDHWHHQVFKLLPRAARDELLAERVTIRGRAEPSTNTQAYTQLHELRKFVLALAHLLLDEPYLTGDEHHNLLDTDTDYAVGVAASEAWAEATFRPYLNTERNLELGKIFAYRILDDAINLAAAYLATPIHIFTISSSGQATTVSGSECDRIAETCETWRELERETVGTLLAPSESDDGDAKVPEP